MTSVESTEQCQFMETEERIGRDAANQLFAQMFQKEKEEAGATVASDDKKDEEEETQGDIADADPPPVVDTEEEEFYLGFNPSAGEFSMPKEIHERLVDIYDDIRPQDADQSTAYAQDGVLIEQSSQWLDHNPVSSLSTVVPAASLTDHVVGAGFGSQYAVCMSVDSRQDTFGLLDPQAERQRHADEYVTSVRDDAKECTTLAQVAMLQSLFVSRCANDPLVHAHKLSVKKCIQRKKKKITERMKKLKDEALSKLEDGTTDVEKLTQEAIDAEKERVTGIAAPDREEGQLSTTALAKHPEVVSMVSNRPVVPLQMQKFATSSAIVKGTLVVTATADDEQIASFVDAEKRVHAEAQKVAKKALWKKHSAAFTVAAICADYTGEEDSVDADKVLVANALAHTSSVPKAAVDTRTSALKWLGDDKIGTLTKEQAHMTLGVALAQDSISLDTLRLGVYRAKLLLAAARVHPSGRSGVNDLARLMGYPSATVALGDVAAHIAAAEAILGTADIGKRWSADVYSPAEVVLADEKYAEYACDEVAHSFNAKLHILRVDDAKGGGNPNWTRPSMHAGNIRTTGAIHAHGNDVAIGSMGCIRVINIDTGKMVTRINLSSSWGGRITRIVINERMICALMDYPEGYRKLTPYDAIVYHRKDKTMRAFMCPPRRITAVYPDPVRNTCWIGTEKGYAYGMSLDTDTLDDGMMALIVTATASPIKRINRVGRRIHLITCTDVFTQDVCPLDGETISRMQSRTGRVVQSRLEFPSAHTRFGPKDFALLRNYQIRMLVGGSKGFVRVFQPPPELDETEELEAFDYNQHVEYRPGSNRLFIMYGNSRVRVLWPGPTSMRETEKMKMDRSLLHAALESCKETANSSGNGSTAEPEPGSGPERDREAEEEEEGEETKSSAHE